MDQAKAMIADIPLDIYLQIFGPPAMAFFAMFWLAASNIRRLERNIHDLIVDLKVSDANTHGEIQSINREIKSIKVRLDRLEKVDV